MREWHLAAALALLALALIARPSAAAENLHPGHYEGGYWWCDDKPKCNGKGTYKDSVSLVLQQKDGTLGGTFSPSQHWKNYGNKGDVSFVKVDGSNIKFQAISLWTPKPAFVEATTTADGMTGVLKYNNYTMELVLKRKKE